MVFVPVRFRSHSLSFAFVVMRVQCRLCALSFASVVVHMCCCSIQWLGGLAANRKVVDRGGGASVGWVMIEAVGVLTV